jgi:hypothetical protein
MPSGVFIGSRAQRPRVKAGGLMMASNLLGRLIPSSQLPSVTGGTAVYHLRALLAQENSYNAPVV